MSDKLSTAPVPQWEIRTHEPYFMGESIAKIPSALEACLEPHFLKQIETALGQVHPACIFAVGTGTSYNACESVAYTCRKILGIPVEVYDSLEFELDTPLGVAPGALVIFISHSGRTLATVLAVKKAQSLGAFTVGIAANAGSPLVTTADHGLVDPNPYEGRPRGKTRSYHTSIVLGTLAAVLTAPKEVSEAYIAGIRKVSVQIRASLPAWEKAGRALAKAWGKTITRYMVAGFGSQKPNAYELGLKIIEVFGENATSYSLEELTHGPGASFRKELGIILFQTDMRTLARCMEIARGVLASEASVLVITDQDSAAWPEKATIISIPAVDKQELFGLFPAAAAAQNVLYYLALEKGLNPDENTNDQHPELAGVSAIFFPPGTH